MFSLACAFLRIIKRLRRIQHNFLRRLFPGSPLSPFSPVAPVSPFTPLRNRKFHHRVFRRAALRNARRRPGLARHSRDGKPALRPSRPGFHPCPVRPFRLSRLARPILPGRPSPFARGRLFRPSRRRARLAAWTLHQLLKPNPQRLVDRLTELVVCRAPIARQSPP